MTYITKHRARRPMRKRGLAGAFDDFVGNFNKSSDELACLNKANATPGVVAIEARIRDLNLNWNPTGFYTPDDVGKLVTETLKVTSSASSLVAKAPRSTSDATEQINQAITDIQNKAAQSLNYTAAAQEARAKGLKAINAPGMKQWVISTLQTAANALVTAAVMDCNMTWLASAIIAYQKVFDGAAAIIKRVVGVIIKLGELALDVIEETPDLLKKLVFVAKWGAVAFAVAFAVRKVKQARG